MKNYFRHIENFITKRKCSILFCLGLTAGLLIGRLTSQYTLIFEYDVIKDNFREVKIFAEVVYFILASLLIPIAFFQYMGDRQKEKKGDVQYAHQLYRTYVEDILTSDQKITTDFLRNLNLNNPDAVRKFNEMLNMLDAFAAAFIHGIADSDSGKTMMGDAYCYQVDKYRPALSRISEGDYQRGFENMFSLYEKWKGDNG